MLSFFSKSLLLNEKAKSFSKPELEIFEDEVSCSHGASFGEIEKEKVFYLQSRGFSKKDRQDIKKIYNIFFRSKKNRKENLSTINKEFSDNDYLKTISEFIQNSKRGII